MEDKKRKRTTLILLALLALLIGLLIPFTWRSFKAVKAALVQENSLVGLTSTTATGSFSGSSMHGGWVPSSTPIPQKTATSTATFPPSPTSTTAKTATVQVLPSNTPENTATLSPSPIANVMDTATLAPTLTATVPDTATLPPSSTLTIPVNVTETAQTNGTTVPAVTETAQVIATSVPEVTKTATPTGTAPRPTNMPFGGTGTAEAPGTSAQTAIPPVVSSPTQPAIENATQQPCLPCTATAQVSSAPTIVLNATQGSPTSTPNKAPTVGPGGNPSHYATAGLVFGLIAIAAFILYFSGTIVTKRRPE